LGTFLNSNLSDKAPTKCDQYSIQGRIDLGDIDVKKISLRINGNINRTPPIAQNGSFNFPVSKEEIEKVRIEVCYNGEINSTIKPNRKYDKYDDTTCDIQLESAPKITILEDKKKVKLQEIAINLTNNLPSTSKKIANDVIIEKKEEIKFIFSWREVGGLLVSNKDTIGTISANQYAYADISITNTNRVAVYKSNKKICEIFFQYKNVNSDKIKPINCPEL
jgi:hypothetical protein